MINDGFECTNNSLLDQQEKHFGKQECLFKKCCKKYKKKGKHCKSCPKRP